MDRRIHVFLRDSVQPFDNITSSQEPVRPLSREPLSARPEWRSGCSCFGTVWSCMLILLSICFSLITLSMIWFRLNMDDSMLAEWIWSVTIRIPSRGLTYPPKMAFWRWFPKVGYVNSLEGISSSSVFGFMSPSSFITTPLTVAAFRVRWPTATRRCSTSTLPIIQTGIKAASTSVKGFRSACPRARSSTIGRMPKVTRHQHQPKIKHWVKVPVEEKSSLLTSEPFVSIRNRGNPEPWCAFQVACVIRCKLNRGTSWMFGSMLVTISYIFNYVHLSEGLPCLLGCLTSICHTHSSMAQPSITTTLYAPITSYLRNMFRMCFDDFYVTVWK